MNTPRLTRSNRHGARGQTLPIFAFGLVALLAITALVVDVGFVFMIRRHEQNAADPGALAAARYIPSGNRAQMWTGACTYALRNGFQPTRTDNGAACDPTGVFDDSTLTVNWPPGPSAGAFAGSSAYVEVILTRPHQSFFAGVLGMPTFTVSTGAVAAYDEGTGGSSSLVSLSPKDCGGGAAAKVNGGAAGTGGIRIFPATGVTDPGGYIQVNSPCGAPTNTGDDECLGSTGGFMLNGTSVVEAPALFVQGSCGQTGNHPGALGIDFIDEGASYVGDPLSHVPPPNPGDLVTRACPDVPASKSGTPGNPKSCKLKEDVKLSPGTYYGGWDITTDITITLEPGIYIMAGGGIKQTGGSLTSATGRVLIYSTDAPQFHRTCLAGGGSNAQCQDDINLSGSGDLDLRGLDRDAPCPPYSGPLGCPYGGMLVWQDGNGSGAHSGKADIDIGGGTSLNIEGTVYTAGGHAELQGNSVSTGCTSDADGHTNCAAVQIIADTFGVGGGALLEMPYDPDKFYHLTLKGLVR